MGYRRFLVGDRRRIAPVVILVIALHAVLLAVPVRSVRPQGGPNAGTSVQVRMLGAPGVEATAAIAAVPSVQAERVGEQPLQAPAAPKESTKPIVLADATVRGTPVSPPLPALGLVKPGIDSDADYYPRGMLSQGPSPLDTIVIDYPPIPNDSGHHVSELTLFIDETGRVARVRVDGAALPPALEAAARNAFAIARFRAGEVEGRTVKSRIRIEVVFDNRPPGSPR